MKRRLNSFKEKTTRYIKWLVYIVVLGIGVYLISRPVISIIRTSKDISELEEEKAKYQAIIKENEEFLRNLNNREFLERYARETYYMQRPNEQIFIIEE